MLWVARQRREQIASWPRITITLSDRAREFVDFVRNAQDSSASEAINHLLLKDESRKPKLREENGLVVIDIEDEGPPITPEDIQIIEDKEFVYPKETQKLTPSKTSIAISPAASAIVARLQKAEDISQSHAISKLIENSM